MNSIHATIPSENWDDDFEFQQKTTSAIVAHDQHVEHRMSIASSDWDHDDDISRTTTTMILEDKKNTYNPPVEWVEPGPSTPKRHAHARSTENWDDDFEDSPIRKHFPSPPQKNKSGGATRLRKTLVHRPESWDDEFDSTASPLHLSSAASPSTSPSSSPSKRPRQTRVINAYSSSEDEDNGAIEQDDELDFGYAERDEEDRTVTARSRRAALSRLTSPKDQGTPPPPVPALPLPFLLNSSNISNPHPFPRSPTSSVFSVPRPPSSAQTVTSTTHLRPTVSRSSSSGFSGLPPSPPIHRERERRRLRKKSRPQQGAGVIELETLRVRDVDRERDNTGYDRETGDGLTDPNPDHDVIMRPQTPPSHPVSGASTPASPGANSGAGALLSRIGSVKKWGVRRKRGSTTPGDMLSLGKLDADTRQRYLQEIDNNLTPRPHSQASMSSVPSSESSNTHSKSKSKRMSAGSASGNTNTTGNISWFFRSGSGSHPQSTPSTSSSPLGPRGSNSDLNLRGRGLTHVHTPTKTRLEEVSPSPSKLVKRKSLGFVQLRRGFGGNGGAGGDECEKERQKEKEKEGRRHVSAQHAPIPQKYGGLGLGRAGGNNGGEGMSESGRDPNEEQEGSRGFMGSVRRLSLVGRHKRTKSGVSLANVTELEGALLPPTRTDTATPTPVQKQKQHSTPAPTPNQPLLPPIELQPPSPPRKRVPIEMIKSASMSEASDLPSDSMLSPSTPSASASSSASPSPSPQNASPTSPSRRTGLGSKTPGSPQAASLGRSTIGPGNSAPSTGGESSPAPRRNSLGDLKIPERISQAQVGLRRDLGMVREFAANVEQLKELQSTYNDLVGQVQEILDTHVYAHAQQQQQLPPRANSPGFFASFSRPMSRHRSNTGPTPVLTATLSPPSASFAHAHPQAAYKQLASTFYTINSKYRISWECAELLIELGGGGSTNADNTSTSAPSTSVSAPAVPSVARRGSVDGKKGVGSGRERAITLAGDESKPPTPTPGSTGLGGSTRLPSPPIASPPSLAWRASTGRHDLSQRQLVLLKEMLNNADSTSAFATEDVAGAIPEESPLSASAMLNLNRDWRWGDATSSTVTLPSEDSGMGSAGGDSATKKKKRRSSRLGMTGLRDMLRSLKRSHSENPPPTPPVPASSTSLSTNNSSHDGHIYFHGHIPPTQGRRRAKTSSGPESIRLGRPTSPYSPSSLVAKQSPRRPSLASIFRLGQKNKTLSPTSDISADIPTDMHIAHPHLGNRATRGRESSSAGEEEDWDRMDSASDLDAAARALGIGHDGLATIRGKGRSPYMQDLHPPPLPGLPDNLMTPKRSASASQSSIWGEPNNSTSPPLLQPLRTTRLSNVEEHMDDQRQVRPSSKGSNYKAGASPSRRSSRGSRIGKTGSVRSMPPQPVLPDPKLAMTPENIKPLLDNAKEVHTRLNECIAEIRSLLVVYLRP